MIKSNPGAERLVVLRAIALVAAVGTTVSINLTVPLSEVLRCTTTHADLPDLLALVCLVLLIPLAGVLTWLGRLRPAGVNLAALLPVLGTGIWASDAAFQADTLMECQTSALEQFALLVYLSANIAFVTTMAFRFFSALETKETSDEQGATDPARVYSSHVRYVCAANQGYV